MTAAMDTEKSATPRSAEESSAAPEPDAARVERKPPKAVSVRALVTGVVVVVLAAAVGVLAWLYVSAEGTIDAQKRQAANYKHAEDVALDYAVNAAVMDFHDLGSWKTKLVAGTSPELKDKLTKAADSMEQILVPLQWNSTAKPLVAKVRSESGGVYVVDSFVNVVTKTMQAPDGLQSTATYSITMDANNNWQITDVGGIDAVMPPK
ncbi:hypothetical protein [Mycobacterium sp. shizuoka-1]|uniref:hypothetical protein n=1 Tax=Mycobacterium sp. shizuoka-1 TaxID=2039281 RepID=UPI000C062401|nr:hypothetical protein [Mycobacterium sp. shizuoka-1]GAY17661.1 hypothetical protein MSZK_43870 [Mycobacterium sp. shizuoka-1]